MKKYYVKYEAIGLSKEGLDRYIKEGYVNDYNPFTKDFVKFKDARRFFEEIKKDTKGYILEGYNGKLYFVKYVEIGEYIYNNREEWDYTNTIDYYESIPNN